MNMRTLAGGLTDFRSIREALLKLDTREKSVIPTMTSTSTGSKSYVEADVEDAPPPPRQVSVDVDSYFSDPPDDAFELPEAEAETFLSALEEQELPEEELMVALAA
eukprot:2735125-Pyramimonas_sp.AAC.1